MTRGDLDDWTGGVGRTSEQLLADLRSGMGGMGMGGTGTTMPDAGWMGMMASRVLGGDAGDVRYPLYLLNGRHAGAPPSPSAPVD